MHTYIQMSEGVDLGSPDSLAPKTRKTDDQCGASSKAGPLWQRGYCMCVYMCVHARTNTHTHSRANTCMYAYIRTCTQVQ